MKGIFSILKKECYSYFSLSIVYALLFIFLILSGYFFWANVQYYARISLYANQLGLVNFDLPNWVIQPLFSNMSVILLLMLPLLTMRSFAEEKKLGNLELLATYPLRDSELVLGKFLGCLVVYGLMLLLTLVYPFILWWLGAPEWGMFLAGYLGLLLLGSAFIAFGLFISSLTENQVVAAALTFGLLLLFWVINWISALTEPPLSTICEQLSLLSHFQHFTKGVIDSSDIIFYLSFIIFGLFLSLRSLEAQRLRGMI